ncbi:hypothetical protein [Rhodoferax aquaticus]|uniref:Uncharacterized protein n=1 Tax=Rhodoferax aquaticus TaxID=2527691 RepID=A0A515ELA6_9BURK|nr:hypothetical protein [Rhodoferax aquaticus]QDL53450.1 hypothetical protein EXZ61_04245 [Rhodoferax aquaticus]
MKTSLAQASRLWLFAPLVLGTAMQASAQLPSTHAFVVSALDAAQAATPVPKALYHSTFDGFPLGVEQPRIDWKQANANVGQFKRGYPDLLKWEQEQAKPANASQTSPQPTPPAGSRP